MMPKKQIINQKEGKLLVYWNLYYDPSFSLNPATIKGCLRTEQKDEDTFMLALLRTWLKDCCSQKWLFCTDLWWQRQRERVATYSRKWQKLVELNECSHEKALLLKRVTILLPWSTNYKMRKFDVLFRGQVQGYWMSFMKEEVSVRKGLLTAAHPLSELCNGRQDIQCLLGEQHQIGKSNNKAIC